MNAKADDDAPDSWAQLLSDDRVKRLRAELSQLGAAVDVRRARCLQASLVRWTRVVKANGYRKSPSEASDHLDRQAQVWRTLLDADTDLDGLRQPTSFLRGVVAGLSVVQVMRAQLVVLTGFTALLAWGAWMLSHQQQHGFLGAIATAVGAIGVTGSVLTAKAKAEAIHLIEKINAAFDSDLDAIATTVVPERKAAWLPDRLRAPGSRTALSVIVYALPAASGGRPSKTSQTGSAGQADATTELTTTEQASSPVALDPGAAPAGSS